MKQAKQVKCIEVSRNKAEEITEEEKVDCTKITSSAMGKPD